MSDYCHEQKYKIRYSDVDFKDELKPSSVLSFAQETATTSADELGFGYEVLKKDNYAFVVVASSVEFVKPMRLGETITVQTWPLPPRLVIFERDYRFFNEQGEVCANMASRWCLINLNSFALLTPDRLEAHARCPYRKEQTLSPVWKVKKIETRGEPCHRITVKNSHCDHYLHLNNAKYAELFFDCFGMDELSEREVKGLTVVYHKQIKEGSEIAFYRKDEQAQTYLEAYVGDELCTQCLITFVK